MTDLNETRSESPKLQKTLTPLGAWALSMGCAIGWGSFVMPGSSFLPTGGPAGTAIGMGIAALIMVVISMNYNFMLQRYQDAGGTFSFVRHTFGYDHAFLSAWFLLLTYTAMMWANATALLLIARNILGPVFQTGGYYQIFGFDVYMGEALLSVVTILVFGLLCLRSRLAGRVESAAMLLFCAGVLICFFAVLRGRGGIANIPQPSFSPASTPLKGIIGILVMGPWAFVGFEAISHSSEEFGFSRKRVLPILLASVVTSTLAYVLLTSIAASIRPPEYADWYAYTSDLGSLSGAKGLPVFYAVQTVLGSAGTVILGVTVLCAVLTSLIGNMIAASRLLYAMAESDLLPARFTVIGKHFAPKNAILFLIVCSLAIPFLGRTAIGWIVDVNTVGATIAYAYTSFSAAFVARKEGRKFYTAMGITGIVFSLLMVVYFFLPTFLGASSLSAESYLILAAWSLLGFIYFRYVFKRDREYRLGRSTVVWIVLLALIFFTSLIWIRQIAQQSTHTVAAQLDDYYISEMQEAGIERTPDELAETEQFLNEQLKGVSDNLMTYCLIMTAMIVLSVFILFSIYATLQKRQRQTEVEKALAEETSRAKTSFLSNMSHEIRTPLNAIIGLDNIALKEPGLLPKTREQLEKIGGSAKHLLNLINDILDMSRIESGRMVLKEEDFLFSSFIEQINVMINGQCMDKGLTYECRIVGRVDGYYVGDDMKLKQVLINILGNAVKFTNPPGIVSLTVEELGRKEDLCTLQFTVRDTGIGMDREYIPRIFDAFTQEDATATNRYGGSGLGMAITKNIVEMMGGTIAVDSEKGVGTTFTVKVALRRSGKEAECEEIKDSIGRLRILVVDDDPIACEHAKLVLQEIGIQADTCLGVDEAEKRLDERKQEGKPYHILISDLRMPGTDGIDMVKAIRAGGDSKLAIIMMTGYNWDDVEGEANEAGIDGFMPKPLFPETVRRALSEVLAVKNPLAGEESAEPAGEQENVSVEGLRLMLAEDIEINAEILMELLMMEGIETERAENGEAAVSMFAEHDEHYYDAILMDVRMPVMDGLAAAKAIRDMDRTDAKTIPIIALTANAFEEDVQQSVQAGMNAHLSKPVEMDRLLETLRTLAVRRQPV